MNYLKWIVKDTSTPTLQIDKFSKNEILCLANDINSLMGSADMHKYDQDISLPRVVVVGTQSSGKSTVLNAVTSMDVIPTGDAMVTRVPLEIQLNKLEEGTDAWVEFWNFKDNSLEEKFSISAPTLTQLDMDTIRDKITEMTNKLAGSEKNISCTPIILKVYSPYVPNLSFTDLPGLVMIPRTDHGQPKDIKQRIEKMVLSYVRRPKTIVLVIMQSRTDLEADIGLSLVLENALADTKIIGVLTKPDLMNTNTHVGDYLQGSVSDSLKLNQGYYLIKGRNNEEKKENTLLQGLELEKEYFKAHAEYKKILYEGRLGVGCLVDNLTNLLITDIKKDLPGALDRLVDLETTVTTELEKLGDSIPGSKEGKLSILNVYVSKFCHQISLNMASPDNSHSTPVELKSNFIKYRNHISAIKPFVSNQKVYNTKYFKALQQNLEGNHMSCFVSPVEILEHCIRDLEHNPVKTLYEPSYTIINLTVETIRKLIHNVLRDPQFSKYKKLASFIEKLVCDNYLGLLEAHTRNKVEEILDCQRSYVWTEDPAFKERLNKFNVEKDSYSDLLEHYFATIKYTVQDLVPKMIMLHIVGVVQRGIASYLYDEIVNKNKIEYVYEDKETDKLRRRYSELKQRIGNIKKTYDTLS